MGYELYAEGPLALALVAVLEVALHRHRLPRLLVLTGVQLLVVQLVKDDLLGFESVRIYFESNQQ